MKLADLFKQQPDAQIHGDGSVEVSGVSFDSRRVRAGDLFFALKGLASKGVDFVPEAIRRGAAAIVTDTAENVLNGIEATAVKVSNARATMARTARLFYGFPDKELRVVGITGTNGKTTTAFVAKHLLQSTGWRTGLIGTVRYEIGDRLLPAPHTTPESSDLFAMMREMVDAGCRATVMEVSSHALSQQRVEGLDFDVAVFTNLTRDHLDYHGTMEDYFAAKERLFLTLGEQSKQPYAVINCDDSYGQRLVVDKRIRAVKITFGSGQGELQWRLVNWRKGGARAEFTYLGKTITATLPIFGQFNLANAAAALAAAVAVRGEKAFEKLVAALENLPPVPGRLEPVPCETGASVFVDYAHTDDALRKVLDTLKQLPHKRILTVFGCGGNRDRTKRRLMGEVAKSHSDVLFVTSDNPRWEEPKEIIDDILSGIADRKNVFASLDRREAIRAAVRAAGQGDILLIAGKGHETYQEVAGQRMPFDDRLVAAEALGELCVR